MEKKNFSVWVGIFCYLPVDIVPLAGEGTIKAVADVLHIPFGRVKVVFDSTMVAVSLATCLISLHTLGSVRIGTIASAVLVGMIVGFLNRRFGKKVSALLGGKKEDFAGTSAQTHGEFGKTI